MAPIADATDAPSPPAICAAMSRARDPACRAASGGSRATIDHDAGVACMREFLAHGIDARGIEVETAAAQDDVAILVAAVCVAEWLW
jgi:hypothetical protein